MATHTHTHLQIPITTIISTYIQTLSNATTQFFEVFFIIIITHEILGIYIQTTEYVEQDLVIK